MSLDVVTAFNNFSRGQLDQDMDGRFDLPIYSAGATNFENWISNFKGNAIYRSGFEHQLDFQDSALMEFKFSQNQNYLMVGYASKIRFASFDSNNDFGWVLNGGSPFEVDTPYNLAEIKEIANRAAYTQNFDSMIFTKTGYEPYELTRTAANDFTFRPFARKDDPFPLTWQAAKTILGITQAAEASVNITSHSYSVNDRVKIEAVVGMTEVNDWTATVIEVVDANNFKIDIDTTDSAAYTSGGTTEKVLTGDYPDTCLYFKGRLYYGGTGLKITTIWASESGEFKVHTIPSTVLAESALEFTIAELDSRIEWLARGQNSLLVGTANDIVPVHGSTVGEAITAETIDTTSTDATGTSSAQPLTKDGFLFYVTNDGRQLQYFNYDILSESFDAENANVLARDITKGNMTKVRYVKTREDLIYALRGDNELLTCNFNKKENIIGWHNHSSTGTFHDIASISDNNGVEQLFVLAQYNSAYYIERQAEYVEFSKRKNFFTDVEATDKEAYYRKVAEEMKNNIYVDNAFMYNDIRTTTLTYDSGAGTITASGASFVAGNVDRHISFRTDTGYESGRFKITGFTSTTVVDVEVLVTPTETVWSDWYMSFNSVSSLTRFNGTAVSVVADGGYLDDFDVSGGTIALSTEATHVVLGYGYRGTIESFALGFQVQTQNTQAMFKAISRVGLRCHDTAGGRFGGSNYRLEEVQTLTQADINYLPPLPINKTKFVDLVDDHEVDKTFSIVQDKPLPMTVTAVMLEGSYAV